VDQIRGFCAPTPNDLRIHFLQDDIDHSSH
jgi:hypothetical protein